MRKLLFLAALIVPALALADAGPLEELNQKCEKEKTSMFRENNGTPSCDKLNKIYSDYENRTMVLTQDLRKKCDQEQNSMFKENNGTPSCERLNQALRDRATQQVGKKYGFSKERGKMCYFNDVGDVLSCP